MGKKIISDKESDALNYNEPKKRQKEFAGIRIYSDENIGEILRRIEKIERNITMIKRQLSAHDYNIVGVLKKQKYPFRKGE